MYLITSERISFGEFGKMLAGMIPSVEEGTGNEWRLESSAMEVNKDILYDSLSGETEISAGKNFFIVYPPIDHYNQAQTEAFADSISQRIGDKVVTMPGKPGTKGNESHLVSFSYVTFFIFTYPCLLYSIPEDISILQSTV